MYRTDKDDLNIKDIEGFLKQHEMETKRYLRLQDYYEGRHKILEKKRESDSIPNEKIVNPYPKYITDVLTGYFVGQPILYSAVNINTDKDDLLLEQLLPIFKYNDEQEENLELARTCSIKGKAYELLYIDQLGNIRFKYLQPEETFLIYDNTIEENVKFGVRHYIRKIDNKEVKFVEVYDTNRVQYYSNRLGNLQLEDEKLHYFKEVPLILYENNREQIGDFEPVISLIDAYDLAQSNTINDMEQFTDAYLVLMNMGGTDEDDIIRARKSRTLLLQDDGDAKWLIKDVNDAWVENYKNRISSDIHKFSGTPDMTDENFGSNLSGVSLRYKLLAMEQIRANKERKFKKGLQRRIEIISNILRINHDDIDAYTGIEMQFNNTLPQNVLEISQIITALSPYLPIETLIEQLPFVENASEEIEKKKAEDEAFSANAYGQFFKEHEHKHDVGDENELLAK